MAEAIGLKVDDPRFWDAQHLRGEVDRMPAGEPAVAATARGADGGKDVGGGHGALPEEDRT